MYKYTGMSVYLLLLYISLERYVSGRFKLYSDATFPGWSKPKFLTSDDCLNYGTPLTELEDEPYSIGTSLCDLRIFDNYNRTQPVYPQSKKLPTVYLM